MMEHKPTQEEPEGMPIVETIVFVILFLLGVIGVIEMILKGWL